MVIIIVIVITSALYQDSRINFCRKKKEHADTPPSEAEHMVCEVNENKKKKNIKKMVGINEVDVEVDIGVYLC